MKWPQEELEQLSHVSFDIQTSSATLVYFRVTVCVLHVNLCIRQLVREEYLQRLWSQTLHSSLCRVAGAILQHIDA